MATLQGTPKKLPNGKWGAHVNGPVEIGDDVKVTTRGGKSWTITVAAVFPGGLVAKADATLQAPKSRGGLCGNCDEYRRNLRDAWDSSNLSGRACPKCIRNGGLSFA